MSSPSPPPPPPSPPAWSASAYASSLALARSFGACTDQYIAAELTAALAVLSGAYRTFGGPSRVIGSYNGGKDACVIMHLIRAAHALQCEAAERAGGPAHRPRPTMIFFNGEEDFPEVKEFVWETAKKYELDLVVYDGKRYNFVEGLTDLIARSPGAGPMAFVLGTRAADPNAGGQESFSPSSDWMPPFMRVNPVLAWDYGHIWHFLRAFDLPYCSLYDEGYTSLGRVADTAPCPALAKGDGKYWPAYMLSDWTLERAGRTKKKRKDAADDGAAPPPSSSSSDASTGDDSATAGTDGSAGAAPLPLPPPVVGLLVIGDEILKGQTGDLNVREAAVALRSRRIPLARVAVVPDDLDDIVAEIARMCQEVDVVVTSGGVGPTHDDVTLRAVAGALGMPLVRHPGMVRCLLERHAVRGGAALGAAALDKMALLPRDGVLRYLAGRDEWPILQCRNLYVLPGVPQFFAAKIHAVAAHLAAGAEPAGRRAATRKVVLSVAENSIVGHLNEVVGRHPHVAFGSYPFVDHPQFKTVVTLEGKECPQATRPDVALGTAPGRFARRNSWPVDTAASVPPVVHFTPEEMEQHVRAALSDLIALLPGESVLRVNREDSLSTTPLSRRK